MALPSPLIAGLLTGTLALAGGPLEDGYERVADKLGVVVYQKQGAKAIELAAEGVIAAPPDRVRAVLLDYPAHPDYVAHLAESRVLARGADWLVVYQLLDLPMIADRDFTLQVKWGQDGETLWTRFATANPRGPAPRDRTVRIAVHEGGWELEPVDGGRATRARYRVRLDLAGSLPKWMARGQAGKDVPSMFQAVRERAAH